MSKYDKMRFLTEHVTYKYIACIYDRMLDGGFPRKIGH